ncbi:MAG: hypothetical protein ACI9MC_002328 [Kiritimatiellia bacterium]|jgi:hypothetical protein
MGVVSLTLVGCGRATGSYDVQIYGDGTSLDEVLPPAEPMVGAVEYARLRLWGINLGLGLAGAPGDQPRADGQSVVVGSASFAYPADGSFDRGSALISVGPVLMDRCLTRLTGRVGPGSGEYVDVGDHVALVAEDGLQIRLERDPAVYPRPAGEAWFVGYGGALGPDLQGHELLPDTWRSSSSFTVSFPGGIPPETSMLGSVPTPSNDIALRLPTSIEGLAVDGAVVRAPVHTDEADDDVRFSAPWSDPVELTWTPASPPEPLTVSVRVVALGEEAPCGCDADCGSGFTCDEGACVGDDGASWNQVGEVVCTLTDDGAFTLHPSDFSRLGEWGAGSPGALLVVARLTHDEGEVPPIRTWAGKKVDERTVRTRGIDAVVTRVLSPPE